MMFKASYKGVPFLVRSTDVQVGRRNVLHEYPLRDTPYIEDMGKAARTFSFDAFLLGADCQAQALKLIDVLEQSGDGKLVHPYLGSIVCNCTSRGGLSINETQRIVTLSLSFVETGALTYPSTTSATDFFSRTCADSLLDVAQSTFLSSVAMPIDITSLTLDVDRITNALQTDLADIQATLLDQSFINELSISDQIAALTDISINMQSLSALELSDHVASCLNTSSFAQDDHNWRQTCISVCNGVIAIVHDTQATSNFISTREAGTSSNTTSVQTALDETEQLIIRNRNALKSLTRQVLLSQSVGMSSLIGTQVDKKTNSLPPKAAIRDDVVSVRAYMISAFNAEESLQDNYNLLSELRKARTAVWQDLTLRAEKAQELYTKNFATSIPALVLAYEEYGDVNRHQEIIERNHIAQPLFITGEVVLTND